MQPTQRYRLNEPEVIQELIDGEAIIADLGKGFYYSLDNIGSQVWHALVRGATVDGIVDALTARYRIDRQEVAAAIAALVGRLSDERLIVPDDAAGNSSGDNNADFSQLSQDRFTPPVLSKFTDMEQLLLLDPIHEVDETGWPNAPGDEAKD